MGNIPVVYTKEKLTTGRARIRASEIEDALLVQVHHTLFFCCGGAVQF